MTITIRETGPLATVQDLGRPGYAHLGVPGSGAADRGAMMLANRLVGNTVSAATIECTLGGLTLTTDTDVLMAVTGADTVVRVDGTPVGVAAAVALRAGSELSVDAPSWGCRNYVAVRGGVDVPPVLGSRSTDVLSGLGRRHCRRVTVSTSATTRRIGRRCPRLPRTPTTRGSSCWIVHPAPDAIWWPTRRCSTTASGR